MSPALYLEALPNASGTLSVRSVTEGGRETMFSTNGTGPNWSEHVPGQIEALIAARPAGARHPVRVFIRDNDQATAGDAPLWEALRLSDGLPVACRNEVTLVHTVPSISGGDAGGDRSLSRPLSVLVAACSPDSLPPLNLDAELSRIRSALRERDRQGSVIPHYRVLKTQTDLINALNEVKPDVFHFIGHTVVHNGVRLLALASRLGHHVALEQDTLRTLLLNAGVSLAVLNACETKGIARYLARHGIAALGMHDIIIDSRSRELAEGLYMALARGEALDEAVNEGRMRLYLANKEDDTWSYPALYVADEHTAGFRVEVEPVPLAELLIESTTPAVARVVVNEEQRGLTPLTVEVRLGYPCSVRLEQEGYHSIERTFTPITHRERLVLALEPRLSSLVVRLQPGVGGAIIRCRSNERPDEVHEAVTDIVGNASFGELPVGTYQVSANFEATSSRQVRVDDAAPKAEPFVLAFPMELHVSQLLSSVAASLARWVRRPSSAIIGALALVIIVGGITTWQIALRRSDMPLDMVPIDPGDQEHQVLGMDVSDENSLPLPNEGVQAYQQRLARSNMIIAELRNTARMEQVDRTWGKAPTIYELAEPLYIDATEVTVRQYGAFLDVILLDESQLQKHAEDFANVQVEDFTPSQWDSQQSCQECPVVGVDFFDAWSYASFVGKRLPRQEEWELAARGFEGRLFPWGDEYKPSIYNGYASHQAHVVPVRVSYEAGRTPNGIYDMAGNADEWVVLDESPLSVAVLGGSFLSRGPIPILPYGYFLKEPDNKDTTIGFRTVSDTNDGTMIELAPGAYPIGGLANFYFDMIRELDDVINGNQSQAMLGETPRLVTIAPFLVDKYEVTVDEYAQFLDRIRDEPNLSSYLWSGLLQGAQISYEPRDWETQLRDRRDLPVRGVTWFMATAYCRAEGKRLPNLYEFEYLMGGREQENLFATGKAWSMTEPVGTQRVNVREFGPRSLVAVQDSEYEQNFGVFHLFGNVEEWVDDPRYMSGQFAFIKGGNYEHTGNVKTFRYFKEAVSKDYNEDSLRVVGFRCARDQ